MIQRNGQNDNNSAKIKAVTEKSNQLQKKVYKNDRLTRRAENTRKNKRQRRPQFYYKKKKLFITTIKCRYCNFRIII